MPIRFAVLLNFALVRARGDHRFVKGFDDGKDLTSFSVGALDADVPGASCGRLSEQGNITAQVKNHVGGTGRLQILRECRADPPLSDSPEINALTFADAHAADVVLALRFNLRVVNLFERRINIASRRNPIAAKTDLPDVDKSADRGLERPVGSLCYGLGFSVSSVMRQSTSTHSPERLLTS